MQMTSLPFWLMIASTATAVLPVWRSPMISSRWPRPIGIIESIALRPVCIGSDTGWRWTTPGALISAGRVSAASMSPLPSSGRPSGSTIRPNRPSPTGMSSRWSVRLTVSPSTTFSHSPKSTTPTLSDSRFSARPVTPWGSSSISSERQFSRPWTRAMPSATERTVPTSVSSAEPASRPSMRLLRMLVISSGLIFIAKGAPVSLSGCRGRRPVGDGLGSHDLLAKVVESGADGRVDDGVPDPHDDPTQDLGVDGARQLHGTTCLPADLVAHALGDRRIELHGARDLDGEEMVGLAPQAVVLAAHAEDDRHAVVLQ